MKQAQAGPEVQERVNAEGDDPPHKPQRKQRQLEKSHPQRNQKPKAIHPGARKAAAIAYFRPAYHKAMLQMNFFITKNLTAGLGEVTLHIMNYIKMTHKGSQNTVST